MGSSFGSDSVVVVDVGPVDVVVSASDTAEAGVGSNDPDRQNATTPASCTLAQ
jgi:hypothetical protein